MAKASVVLSAKKVEALFLIFNKTSLQQFIDMGISEEIARGLIADFTVLSFHHENECKKDLTPLNKALIELTWKPKL